MYQDRRKHGLIGLLCLLVLAVAVIAAAAGLRRRVPEDLGEDSILSIRRAVEQSALQCYAVEGVYPPDIDYLKDNYGLRINTDTYIVRYEAYAENQMPNIRVVKRNR
ncbi:MAG: hypothetical protein IJ120_02950 [Solobacterium sp.]|nr:hypothetical protein [Solobacterium sp.]